QRRPDRQPEPALSESGRGGTNRARRPTAACPRRGADAAIRTGATVRPVEPDAVAAAAGGTAQSCGTGPGAGVRTVPGDARSGPRESVGPASGPARLAGRGSRTGTWITPGVRYMKSLSRLRVVAVAAVLLLSAAPGYAPPPGGYRPPTYRPPTYRPPPSHPT